MPLGFLQWCILAFNQHQWLQRWSRVYIYALTSTHSIQMCNIPIKIWKQVSSSKLHWVTSRFQNTWWPRFCYMHMLYCFWFVLIVLYC